MQQWKSSDTAFASEGITACCMLEFPRHAPLVSVHGGCEHFSPRTVTSLAALLALAACARAPEKVQPSYVAADAYAGQSCEALAATAASLAAQEQDLAKRQRYTRNQDIAGVLLVGLPAGRMTGQNHEKELAQSKGQLLAVQAEQQKRC
jgi:hypothetical protein